MIKQPKISRNYLMNKIHILVGDIKFYEEVRINNISSIN